MSTGSITRREFLGRSGSLLAASWFARAARAGADAGRRNVLFIAVDDLRPELGCYGNQRVLSPNIDRLAQSGMLFERAYCQQAICMSSRASLLSGYRPDVGQMYRNEALYTHVPDALSLNRHFLAQGYATMSIGKIYHHGSDDNVGWSLGDHDPEGDWAGRGYLSEAAKAVVHAYDETHPHAKKRGIGPAFECPEVPDNAYSDGRIADLAVEAFDQLKDEPFFLAVGFRKPHLPFNAPKKYWDLYDPAAFTLAENPFAPKGAPREAGTHWGELRAYADIPREGPMPDDLARKLIHGYYACISYTDAQIGRVLDALEQHGLQENTVVVLWGDHGWKLGEHGMWCKHTNFELDTHVPLLLRAPGMGAGQRTAALTELVDIYPTLCDLCGLEKPAHLQGASAVPLLKNPDRPWKRAAFSQYPRGSRMGYSMRTDTHRYTEWHDLKTGECVARELYDHRNDSAENVNLATAPENKALVTELATWMKDGWEASNSGL